MVKPRRSLLAVAVLLATLLAFSVAGFARGRSAADGLAQEHSKKFVRTGVHLVRVPLDPTAPQFPCWVFSYEDDLFVAGPCHVFVSLAGGIISQDGCER